MRTGIVISYNGFAGSGIIKDPNNQKIRFRQSQLFDLLNKFDVVEYEIELTESGLMAVDVKAIKNLEGSHLNLGAIVH
ncbi:hypothetical protein [Pedobacter rhizosphaerae]|uniref:Cold shock protein, CspA family n=1 Tax=Pedobacter rhizosphaerae TaxID=390241 RepID=A0A1H9JYI1_9SPHI|nr:hypothetical protein [Pedobacter rhizosphaerae]SEQ91919.1 hypothetical protein SAMN04488023_102139 [Pedobacter rhizosphaerae]